MYRAGKDRIFLAKNYPKFNGFFPLRRRLSLHELVVIVSGVGKKEGYKFGQNRRLSWHLQELNLFFSSSLPQSLCSKPGGGSGGARVAGGLVI